MTRLRTTTLQMGVGLGILLLGFLAAFAFEYSGTFALHNPELAHMRWPVLFLVITALFAAIAILVLGYLLLLRVRHNLTFAPATVSLLRAISWISFGAIVPLLILAFYTEANVPSSITNLYVFGLVALCFMLGNLFMLLAELFRSAVAYKSEVDLTV